MTDQELLEIIVAESYEKDGKRRLDCTKAFKIAVKHPVTLRDVGRICNEHEIRIAKCQLGCFK
ncbi:MAG: hypothetical protein FJ098_01450 [Deltaproteobacteria bacterium]|nr:hypothetical protein [Deltaproteobacteria bacterium]